MNWLTDPSLQHKNAVAMSFSRAAEHYDSFALLQQRCGQKLLSLLPFTQIGTLLDAGSGSGWYSRYFCSRGYQVLALDLADGMLQHSKRQRSADWYLRADFDNLPIAAHSFDCIWSNLALQWSSSPENTLGQFLAALKPEGQLRFSTLTAGSLIELTEAWQGMGDEPPVYRYPEFTTLQKQCQRQAVTLTSLSLTCHFPTVQAAMWSLKGVGASLSKRRKTINYLGRNRMKILENAWPKDNKGYRLTYQIALGKNSK